MSTHVPLARVAVVTGAAQGIGKAIALRFAVDGLDVAVNDIPSKLAQLEDVAEQIRACGPRRALVVAGDISQEIDVQKVLDAVVASLGGVDVLVANAGIVIPGNVVDLKAEEWDQVVSVNLRGVFLCYRTAARIMIQQGRGGRIIAASSVVGKHAYPGVSSYCASKFAVRGLTQSAALELGKYGITVNAYAPGVIETDMTGGIGTGGEIAKKNLNIPHAKTGYPEDVASLVSYLASDEAHFITGQTITVDGGLHCD